MVLPVKDYTMTAVRVNLLRRVAVYRKRFQLLFVTKIDAVFNFRVTGTPPGLVL